MFNLIQNYNFLVKYSPKVYYFSLVGALINSFGLCYVFPSICWIGDGADRYRGMIPSISAIFLVLVLFSFLFIHIDAIIIKFFVLKSKNRIKYLVFGILSLLFCWLFIPTIVFTFHYKYLNEQINND